VSAPPINREALEARIRGCQEVGDKKAAATALLDGYGRELFGFLVAHLRDRDAATEVFSDFTEDLWRGLDGFRWQCSARVWSYALVRHAASRYLKSARRRGMRHVGLSRAGPLSAIEEKVRTATLAAARTESRSRVARLRQRLPEDDQTLLILRVSRGLGWLEIAQVMAGEGEPLAEAAATKEAARLRKRYQLAKDKLRQMAIEEGLVPPGGDQN
jgi:RNA polymerase sigma-70 factor, ECF subfamily